MPETKEEELLTETLMNHSRLDIINIILKNRTGFNISEIAKNIGLDRSTVVYHLGLLSKVGMVSESLRPIKEAHSTGVMGRYYTVDIKQLTKGIALVQKEFEDISKSSTVRGTVREKVKND